jgi:acyl-CoA synthetase (AMP-forming)/AMP-acid ligase II/aryl carrier-like protein
VRDNGFVAFGPTDRVAWLGNPAFDISTFEVWAPLLQGAAVIVIPREAVLDPRALRDVVARDVNILHLTAGLFAQVADELGEAIRSLRLLLIGGDRVDTAIVGRVLERHPPARWLHCYGPTETTTFATTYEITRADQNRLLPIGRPIGNTRVYVLDAHSRPVPVGAVGELYVGGDGVARGYLNRDELTAERFLRDPFSSAPEPRMYRTGDRVRHRDDGNLEFLGRADQQVKIRGFRVEVGEIIASLSDHPAVREALVIAVGDGIERRLVAYVTARPDCETDVASLRAHLAAQLPEYMVPAAFVRLERLPLTANGKVDVRALPSPDSASVAQRAYEAPATATERSIAAIWCELLRAQRVGRHDNFFELGGHSLLAVSMIERLRREGLSVEVRTLFSAPTLADLALSIKRTRRISL